MQYSSQECRLPYSDYHRSRHTLILPVAWEIRPFDQNGLVSHGCDLRLSILKDLAHERSGSDSIVNQIDLQSTIICGLPRSYNRLSLSPLCLLGVVFRTKAREPQQQCIFVPTATTYTGHPAAGTTYAVSQWRRWRDRLGHPLATP